MAIGHWPIPMRDDPKGIDSVAMNIWFAVASLMLNLALYALFVIAACLLAMVVLARKHLRYLAMTVLIGLGGWGAGVAWLIMEPWQIFGWMMD